MARRGVGGAWDFLCGGRPAARDWVLNGPAGELPGLVDGVDAVARQECDARDRPPPGRDRGRSRTVSRGDRVEHVGLGAGRRRAGLGGDRRLPTRCRPLRLQRVAVPSKAARARASLKVEPGALWPPSGWLEAPASCGRPSALREPASCPLANPPTP